MFQDDYLMRQVMALTQVLARVMGLRREGLHRAALAETESAMQEMLGMSLELLLLFDPEAVGHILDKDAAAPGAAERRRLRVQLLLEAAACHEAEARPETAGRCRATAAALDPDGRGTRT
jgi:hypothetical protein